MRGVVPLNSAVVVHRNSVSGESPMALDVYKAKTVVLVGVKATKLAASSIFVDLAYFKNCVSFHVSTSLVVTATMTLSALDVLDSALVSFDESSESANLPEPVGMVKLCDISVHAVGVHEVFDA